MEQFNEPLQTKTPFLDLTRDYGFKIVFADPDRKELMIGFLNKIITERNIIDIRFLNTDILAPEEDGKSPNYDISCLDDEGNRFLVEIQKEMYDEFRDRLMVYSGDPLTKILKRGEEYTSVKTLYVISILDGYLKVNGEDKPLKDKLLRRAYLRMDEGSKILSDKLNFLFLQLPVAKEPDAESDFITKWAWYVRNMVKFSKKPEGLDDYFSKLFDAADRNNVEQRKLSIYDRMERDAIQIEAEKRYAIREAREEALAEGEARGEARGKAEGKLEIARAFLAEGVDVATIAKCTGLSEKTIKTLK